MSTLNSRLQLSILNQKKAKNILQKGFTLIELLIVVVILGILSSVALPAFVNQSDKAKVAAGNSWAKANANSCAMLKFTGEQAKFGTDDARVQAGPENETAPTTANCADDAYVFTSTSGGKSYTANADGTVTS